MMRAKEFTCLAAELASCHDPGHVQTHDHFVQQRRGGHPAVNEHRNALCNRSLACAWVIEEFIEEIFSNLAVSRDAPTPASPTRQGLFFRRRLRTCIAIKISLSLPTTSSNFPSSANLFKLTLYRKRLGPNFKFATSGLRTVTPALL